MTLTSTDYVSTVRAIEELTGATLGRAEESWPERFQPTFNGAPQQEHWLLLPPGPTESKPSKPNTPCWRLGPAKWGFEAPTKLGGAPSAGGGRRPLINARFESAPQRSRFTRSTRLGRCALVIDGFYEWGSSEGRRQPYWFSKAHGGLMLIAALAERSATGELRFVTMTQDSRGPVGRIHDRMPMFLEGERLRAWMDREVEWTSSWSTPLVSLEAELRAQRVSPRVNDPSHNDPSCLEPPAPKAQGELFPAEGVA